jgi:hypothetical protein
MQSKEGKNIMTNKLFNEDLVEIIELLEKVLGKDSYLLIERLVDKKSFRKIANGTSYQAVQQRYNKVVAKLRTLVEEYLEFKNNSRKYFRLRLKVKQLYENEFNN